jgi:hypothetical protein
MFGRRELKALEERRRRLLIESEVNRRMLVAQTRGMREAIEWIDASAGIWRRLRRYGLFLAPLAGYLLVRRKAKPSEMLDKSLRFARLLQKLAGIWDAFQTRPGRGGRGLP